MNTNPYALAGEASLPSPQLVYYPEIIEENTRRIIAMAGGPERLWPHIKTHKMRELVLMQRGMGIRRFKCATIAEAEMAAGAGAEHVLLAYPLVGPAIQRFIRLRAGFPATRFYAIGDDEGQLALLSRASLEAGQATQVLLDINLGMDRTGVRLEQAGTLLRRLQALEGIRLVGLHCYDGHQHDRTASVRQSAVDESLLGLEPLRAQMAGAGIELPLLVMGGTPTLPCHACHEGVFLSPGTAFVMDHGYRESFPDLPFTPGAAILARVVSHPAPGRFTLDVGCKAISCDPSGARGVIVGLEQDARPVLHSEEHWVFEMSPTRWQERPKVGQVLYLLPTHICPTTALYAHVLVARGGQAVDRWAVAARDRQLQY